MAVHIVTDSTSSLPVELAAQHAITVVPLYVRFGQQIYRAGIEIGTDEFFQRIATDPILPSTSQPSPGDFQAVYERLTASGDSVVSIHVSDVLSGTLASARTAKETLRDRSIHLINSEMASVPLGLLAIEAARLAKAGADAAAIVRHIEDAMPRCKVVFVLSTLEFLKRGGRIGGAQAFLGSLLNVKPVLHVEHGRVEPVARVRSFAKAYETIDSYVREHAPKGVLHGAILHANAEEHRQRVEEMVRSSCMPSGNLYPNIAIDPVVGVYTGPGAFGFAFMAKL